MVLLKDSFSQRYSNFLFNFFYSTQCLVSAKSDSVQFMSTRSPTLCRISQQGVRLRAVLVSAKSRISRISPRIFQQNHLACLVFIRGQVVSVHEKNANKSRDTSTLSCLLIFLKVLTDELWNVEVPLGATVVTSHHHQQPWWTDYNCQPHWSVLYTPDTFATIEMKNYSKIFFVNLTKNLRNSQIF